VSEPQQLAKRSRYNMRGVVAPTRRP